ncbi:MULTISPECIES: DNA methyltransferase [unclassified Neisseria]|uniref:DNA methyltransferase n=1 Tax=unclassified Neisseria TaxID=2623750 RepID=UPI001D1676D9|nr:MULTISPECIES: DNA methyltransferase [unclassified Neisseria]
MHSLKSGNSLFTGDYCQILPELVRQGVKVQTCITSPPYYGLRDYGRTGRIGLEPMVNEYVENLVDVFRLVRDMPADNGTLWLRQLCVQQQRPQHRWQPVLRVSVSDGQKAERPSESTRLQRS